MYQFGLWCLTPLSTIFNLYRGGIMYQYQWNVTIPKRKRLSFFKYMYIKTLLFDNDEIRKNENPVIFNKHILDKQKDFIQ